MTATVIRLPLRPARAPARPAAQPEDRALKTELRRARVRIAQLEASLAEALRDNVKHHERARQAEQRLADTVGEKQDSSGP
jgi:arginine deiminase